MSTAMNINAGTSVLIWATLTCFMSVICVDDCWSKSKFLGQGPQPFLWAGSRTALVTNRIKCCT